MTDASGSWLETASGRRVLDFTAGQICATIGHNHPRVTAAIKQACDDVIHLNSWMLSPPVLELAGALIATLPSPLARAMFLSTGGECGRGRRPDGQAAHRRLRGGVADQAAGTG